jgi:Ca2+-binding EF-hand superfamily protein
MAFLKETHDPIFDALELNKDGHISNSLDEFKVYFQIIAPDISEDEVTHSFNVIDSNKDDEISCEELLSTFSMVLKKQNYYYNIIIKKIIFLVWAFQYLYIQWKYLNSYAA